MADEETRPRGRGLSGKQALSGPEGRVPRGGHGGSPQGAVTSRTPPQAVFGRLRMISKGTTPSSSSSSATRRQSLLLNLLDQDANMLLAQQVEQVGASPAAALATSPAAAAAPAPAASTGGSASAMSGAPSASSLAAQVATAASVTFADRNPYHEARRSRPRAPDNPMRIVISDLPSRPAVTTTPSSGTRTTMARATGTSRQAAGPHEAQGLQTRQLQADQLMLQLLQANRVPSAGGGARRSPSLLPAPLAAAGAAAAEPPMLGNCSIITADALLAAQAQRQCRVQPAPLASYSTRSHTPRPQSGGWQGQYAGVPVVCNGGAPAGSSWGLPVFTREGGWDGSSQVDRWEEPGAALFTPSGGSPLPEFQVGRGDQAPLGQWLGGACPPLSQAPAPASVLPENLCLLEAVLLDYMDDDEDSCFVDTDAAQQPLSRHGSGSGAGCGSASASRTSPNAAAGPAAAVGGGASPSASSHHIPVSTPPIEGVLTTLSPPETSTAAAPAASGLPALDSGSLLFCTVSDELMLSWLEGGDLAGGLLSEQEAYPGSELGLAL